MRFPVSVALIVVMVFVLSASGCGTKKAESSKAAIDTARAMETTEEKVIYLISQAEAFYKSKEFQGTVDIAQYILRFVDNDSQEARDLLAKAKEAVQVQAQKALEEMGKNF